MWHRNGNRKEKRGNQEGTKRTQRSMMVRVRQKDTTVGNSKQKWGGHQRASGRGQRCTIICEGGHMLCADICALAVGREGPVYGTGEAES